MKNSATLIFSISILILTVIFTLQNAQIARVKFLFWNIEASLSLILFLTLGAGILCAIIVLVPVACRLKSDHKKINEDRSAD